MKEFESILYFGNRVVMIVNQMKCYEDKMKDICVVENILRSLTVKFNFVVCVQLKTYEERFKRRHEKMKKKKKIKEDLDVAKEKEGEVEEEIMTTFITMEGVINPLKVVKEEEVEAILECRTSLEEKANIVGDKKKVKKNDDKSIWYLNSGPSNHMCGYKEKFVDLKEKVNGNVSFGVSSKVQIQGKSIILISLKDGSQKFVLMSRNRMFTSRIKSMKNNA
ncbi:hypothetical protein CR513_57085, partial [Mucuna pruriens]